MWPRNTLFSYFYYDKEIDSLFNRIWPVNFFFIILIIIVVHIERLYTSLENGILDRLTLNYISGLSEISEIIVLSCIVII